MESWLQELQNVHSENEITIDKSFGGGDELIKAKAVPIGTIRKRPNGNFIKTAAGWKYHSSHKASTGGPKKKEDLNTRPKTEAPKAEKPKEEAPKVEKPAALSPDKFDLKKYSKQHLDFVSAINKDDKYAYMNLKEDERKAAFTEYSKTHNVDQIFLNRDLNKISDGISYEGASLSRSDMEHILSGKSSTNVKGKSAMIAAEHTFLQQEKVKKALESMKAAYPDHTLHIRNRAVNFATDSIGTVEVNFRDKDWRQNYPDHFSVKFMYDGNKMIPLGLKARLEDLKHQSEMYSDHQTIQSYKLLKGFAEKFAKIKISEAKIDEGFAKIKKDYENYYSKDQAYSDVYKKGKNLEFRVGDIGKKKNVHDTIRDAASLRPPQQIGDYKLVSSSSVLSHDGKMVDKSKVLKEMLKQDNDYSEYENNVDFTYLYKK